jgi:hypothetical protein
VTLFNSCNEKAPRYHVPQQYQPRTDMALPFIPLLTMGTVNAVDNTIEGILNDDSDWVWSNDHPKFRCFLHGKARWEFYLNFATVNETMKDTGPVTITIVINGSRFSELTVTKAGQREYVHNVSAEIALDGLVEIELIINPYWTSPEDHARLGILVHSIGFRETAK